MKVTLLKSHFATKGGLEKYTIRLANAFAKRGASVTLLTMGESLPILGNIEVISLGKRNKRTDVHLKSFDEAVKRWLVKNRTDIVFGADRNTHQTHYRAGNGVHAVFLKRRAMSDSLFKRATFLLNPTHRRVLSYEKTAFENPHLRCLITGSAMVRNEIVTHFSINPKKVRVVQNGVEWEALAPSFEDTLYDRPFQFLFCGNGYHRKGLTFLLHALALIKHESFTLSVVGKEKNPNPFFHLVKKLGLQERVTFHGVQPSLIPFYQKADALCIPSIYDPFANVTLEALAMGLFVVSSRYNGGKEVLNEGNGVVIDSLTHKYSVADALVTALKHKKTPESAKQIRNSVKELDFSKSLAKIVDLTLTT